ncbi:MAG: hypothetical protein WCI04_01845 [archaeon]
MDSLVFAQKFPFSESARSHLKVLDVQVDDISEQVIKKAALMVSRAFSGGKYDLGVLNPQKELLESEVMAFPVAKMFVSLMKTPNLPKKLAFFIYKNTFNYLVNDSDSKNLCIALADDLKLNYSLANEKGFLAEVPLLEYLKIYFIDAELKLMNMPTNKGVVFLNPNSFARFLAEKAYAKVFDSLPIPEAQVPKKFHALARSLDSQLVIVEKKNFDVKLQGKVDPELFPPCIAAVYTNQLAGKKLSYVERLTLAAFLYQVGMTKEDLMLVQSKSPDFDKRIAEYHVDRIFEKQLSAPSFKKIHDEYGLRVKECDAVEGNFKHPVQLYISKLRVKNRMKNNKKSEIKPEKAEAQK